MRTVESATMEHGKPMMIFLLTESIVQRVAKAGAAGTVKVSF